MGDDVLTVDQQYHPAPASTEESFRSIVDHVLDGIITIDEHGVIQSFNPAAEKIFGYPASDVIGKNVNVLMPEPYHSEHDGYLANYLRTRQARIIGIGREVIGQRRTGATFPMDLAVSEFVLQGKRFFTGIVRDITERKRLERELQLRVEELATAETALRQAHDELELKVEQRTTELARVNTQLNKSLQEKEILLRETHHRVKNNLQVVSSLLDLQSYCTRDLLSVEMFQESQRRVRSMALVHEYLYRSPDLVRVNFSDYLQSLAGHLFESYRVDHDAVQLDLRTGGDFFLPIDTAVPCGLLVNELISNSLKHAFRGRPHGMLRIELGHTGNGQAQVVVADDGVGLPASVDVYSSATFGLQLVMMLLKQLKGTVAVDRSGGTVFRIRFTL